MQQIILAAGFRIRARHVETAKGVCADHGAGAFAVEVQIANVENFLGFRNFAGILRINRACETELRIVGDFQRLVADRLGRSISREALHHPEYRIAENQDSHRPRRVFLIGIHRADQE